MSELEDRLRLGHPEEREHRPAPFADVAAGALTRAADGRVRAGARSHRWRLGALVAAAAVVALAVVGQPVAPLGASAPTGDSTAGEALPPAGASSGPAAAPVAPSAGLRESLDVRCGPASEAECDRIVDAVIAAADRSVVAVDIGGYAPGCLRASPCTTTVDGLDPYLARVRGAAGSAAYLCDAATTRAACRRASAIELQTMARLVITLEGAERQVLSLVDASGTEWTFEAAARREHALTRGRWSLVVRAARPCSRAFDAASGESLEAAVTIRVAAPCRIELR